jgi:SAM-dependent methyltransferase
MFNEFCLDLGQAVLDGKYCYRVSLPIEFTKLETKPKSLSAIVFLDSEVLSVPNIQHQEIRELGMGRYSIWNSTLYFSTPQNQPLTFFSKLYLRVLDVSIANVLDSNHSRFYGESDRGLLKILKINKETNNTFVNNYLESFNTFTTFTRDHLSSRNLRKVFVIGCGSRPILPLRFLAEGMGEVYANDLLEIKSKFDNQEISTLLDTVKLFEPQQNIVLTNSIMQVSESEFSFKNLIIYDKMNFEEIDCPEDFDLTFSNSVLEHVHDVDRFYSKLSQITKVGGYSYHGIDLRDHLNYFKPLEFLKLSQDEYFNINTENRLRSLDHLNYFKKHGFNILNVNYHFIKRSEFKNLTSVINETENCDKYIEVPEILSDIDRSQLHPDFQKYDLRELSIIGISILARKYE